MPFTLLDIKNNVMQSSIVITMIVADNNICNDSYINDVISSSS